MEKLKCTSCGGNLEVEENNKYAECKHCGSKYKLDKDLNINIKIEDNSRESEHEELKQIAPSLKKTALIIGVIFLIGALACVIILSLQYK